MLVNKLKHHRLVIGFLTCVLAGLISNLSFAFTLGDIRLNSALNEPLSANIELLELDGLNETQIRVALGSDADFDRVGVEPLPLLNELEFEVEVLSSSEGVVRITSSDAILEPYLKFVLNVRWPSGRVIREYTLLLDLPTFSANPTPAPAPTPARATPTPPPARPAPQPESEPEQQQILEIQEPDPEPAPVINQTPAAEPSSESVVIQNGDSLWNIALATRPGNDVTVQQMMLAIQRANANSDAFIGNNINGIRAGRVLRIPSRQEINAISQDQALTQVALQNQQFSNSAQPLAVNNSQGSSNNARDELSIVNSADDGADSAEIAGLNATISNLENELAFSEENLDRALLENAELSSRLNDLEEEIAILENIIAIEGQRMAELQEALAEQANAPASDVLAVVPPQSPSPATPSPDTTPLEPSPAPPTGIMAQVANMLGSTLGMIVALVVLLALVVGFLIARNRRASIEEDDFDSILAEETHEGDGEPSFIASAENDADMEEALFSDELAEDIEVAIDEVTADIENELEQENLDEPQQDNENEQDAEQELVSESEDDIFAYDEDEEDEPVKTGFLAGLMAKFSRNKGAEDSNEKFQDAEDYFEEKINEEIDEEADEEALDSDESAPFDEEISEDIDEQIEEVAVTESVESESEAAESNVEEIVFDLNDTSLKDEIEFIDSDDETEEESNEAASSLGKLGLDDAIAFDESDEEELEIITDQDEVSTKLDLAVAYQAMDDIEGAKEILNEVLEEGNEAQIAEANKLLDKWGAT